mmetsp:Transcript_111466/g.249132  ORF Transcript_111466/g.249132 Transcript_111466/m.249132 type:complete len:213 (-) Transcript_111466:271-909(-)
MSISSSVPWFCACNALMYMSCLWDHSTMALAAGTMLSRPSTQPPVGFVERSGWRSQQESTMSVSMFEVYEWDRASARRISNWPHLTVTTSSSDSSSKGFSDTVPPLVPRKRRHMSLCRLKRLSHLPAAASVNSGPSSEYLLVLCKSPTLRCPHSMPRWSARRPSTCVAMKERKPSICWSAGRAPFSKLASSGRSNSKISLEPSAPKRPSMSN